VIWPHLACRSVMRLRLPLAENTDEGCPSGRLRLGMTPLCVVRKEARAAAWLAATLSRSSLSLGNDARVEIQETIPGTSILLTHRLLSRGHSLRVGARVPRLGRRLSRALGIVDSAWGEAGEEIRTRTWMVVPLVEPGTVSYSHLARPGISYLNVFRGGLLDLADDLLHEAAHHRLHARQEISPLAKDDGEPRYYSPWRRAWRPLNGILHGTYTFLFRAELFARLLDARRRMPRVLGTLLGAGEAAFLARELRRELTICSRAQRDLAVAARAGLLTPDGRALVRALAAWRRRIASRTS
jgi:HEXXH motif-containing protein